VVLTSASRRFPRTWSSRLREARRIATLRFLAIFASVFGMSIFSPYRLVEKIDMVAV
jgi:hypothetical protein